MEDIQVAHTVLTLLSPIVLIIYQEKLAVLFVLYVIYNI